MARRTTHTEAWWANASPTILRCTAHYKSDGSQCRSEASAGTNVCDKHGALVPAVQAAAATRIQMSVDEASKKLIDWLSDPAVDMRERIKIAHDLLDRGGLGATSKVLLGVTGGDPVEALFRDLLTREGALAPYRPSAEEWALIDVVEAEVIEDGEDPFSRPSSTPAAQPTPRALEGREEPLHTVHVRESMSSAPPAHLRKDLDRAELLRSLL